MNAETATRTVSGIKTIIIAVGSDLEKWHNVGMLVQVNYEC